MDSKQQLENNLERKFKRLFCLTLKEFETNYDTEIRSDNKRWNKTRQNIIEIVYKIIYNMKKELASYEVKNHNLTYQVRLLPDKDYGQVSKIGD